jgi:hypothetical protein
VIWAVFDGDPLGFEGDFAYSEIFEGAYTFRSWGVPERGRLRSNRTENHTEKQNSDRFDSTMDAVPAGSLSVDTQG